MLSLMLLAALVVQDPQAAPVSRTTFQNSLRELWMEHVAYTRSFIVSASAGLPDTGVVLQRLLRNQDEIADAFKPYYGDAAAAQLASLLREHIQHAGMALQALKGTQTASADNAMNMSLRNDTTKMKSIDTTRARSSVAQRGDSAQPVAQKPQVKEQDQQRPDPQAQGTAIAELRANADSIAAFLNKANPRNWPRATLAGALQMHVNLLLQEASAHAKGDWQGSIAALDASFDQALQLADVLSEGVMKQFPNRFTNKTTNVSSLR